MKSSCGKLGMATGVAMLMTYLFLCSAAIASDPIKVGLLAPMTGPSPEWGKKQIVGMTLAVEKINLRGGINGTPVEMVAVDTGGDPEKAIAAYRRLAAEDKVLAVIGPLFSNTFKALRPITNEEKVPIIATASATPGLSDLEKYPYAFRMTVSSEKKEVAVAQAWAKANDIKTVVVLYDQKNIFSRGLGEKLWPAIFRKQNIKILNQDDPITFETGERDFGEQMKRLKTYNPDGICIAAFPYEGGTLIKEIRQNGFAQPVLGGSAAATPTLIQVAGKSAEGMWSNALFNPSDPSPKVTKYVKTFSKRCAEKYPEMDCQPEQFDVVVYDILQLLANIMKKKGIVNSPGQLRKDRDMIRAGMAKMKMWRGTAGMMGFDKNGDGIRTIHILRVTNGKWQPVY